MHCGVEYILFTGFLSYYGDRTGEYTPSCIGCCHSDGVATVLFQFCYGVAGRAISDGGTSGGSRNLERGVQKYGAVYALENF